MSVIILLMSVFIYQANLAEADRKQILSLLFQQEQGRTILLSPRTDPKWLLDLPGVHFKKLEYGEEKDVSEYYELSEIKVRPDYVELWLSKGDYCKKAITGYEFRKKDGEWQRNVTRRSGLSFGGGGTCPGCKLGRGEPKPAAVLKEPPKDLVLTGEVRAARCKPGDKGYVDCDIDLSLDFSNRGNQPIIILQPHGDYDFWHGGSSLALTKADSEAYNDVYSYGAWPSNCRCEPYYSMARKLDQREPPPDLTRVIAPGERWTMTTMIRLRVTEENTCNGLKGLEIGWSEIKKLSSPVWLRISYEMWPINLDNFKKGLGRRLRERWKKHGILFTEDKDLTHLTSEPIELNLQSVELK